MPLRATPGKLTQCFEPYGVGGRSTGWTLAAPSTKQLLAIGRFRNSEHWRLCVSGWFAMGGAYLSALVRPVISDREL